jgi:hypothetical protein
LRCCDYCGGDREIALLSTIGAQRLCESCATLSLDERKEVKKFQAQKEAIYHGLDDQVMAVKCRLGLNTDSESDELIDKMKDQNDQKEILDNGHDYQMSIDEIWKARQEFIEKNKDQKRLVPCPDPKYDGSLWDYCGEGFRVSWDGHQWNARCTKPWARAICESIFEDVDPVAMEIEGFWYIIEYGGCISTHEKPKPLKRNPNKAPEIDVPWDPYMV